MKSIVMSVVLLSALGGRSQDLRTVRELYIQAEKSESACRRLMAKARSEIGGEPAVMRGYNGVACMMMARFVFNPVSKWNWFRQGRDMLNEAIRMDGTKPELRLLRYCAQRNCPRFLGYYQEVEADREYLLQVVNSGNDDELREMIVEALKSDPSGG